MYAAGCGLDKTPMGPLMHKHVGQYIGFLVARSATRSSKLLRTTASPVMALLKEPLIALRVLQLLAVIFVEFYVTSILIEQHSEKLILDSSLLARVAFASLVVIWAAATFCWSTCFNKARVLARVGMYGDAVTTLAYVIVAILSRTTGTANCTNLGDKVLIWSESLDAWIDIEGAALGPKSLVRSLDSSILEMQCRLGKWAFAASIVTW